VTPLDRESRVFSRYLLGSVADGAILATYAVAVEGGTAGPFPESGAFDRLLSRVARIHPVATRAVDVYARHFCAAAPVRKRLILMLAILESHARPYAVMDTVDGGGRALVFLRIGGAVISSLFLLVLATVFLSPLRLVMAGRPAAEG
jgi:hypothetical protein